MWFTGSSLEVKSETDSNDAVEIKTEADSNDITEYQHDGRTSIGTFGLFHMYVTWIHSLIKPVPDMTYNVFVGR